MSIHRRRYNCWVRGESYVGRIGGPAVALGVGAVLFINQGMACASSARLMAVKDQLLSQGSKATLAAGTSTPHHDNMRRA